MLYRHITQIRGCKYKTHNFIILKFMRANLNFIVKKVDKNKKNRGKMVELYLSYLCINSNIL